MLLESTGSEGRLEVSLFSVYDKTSDLVILPSLPVPLIMFGSRLYSDNNLLTTGDSLRGFSSFPS